MNVESIQNTSESTSQQMAANLQIGVAGPSAGKVAGGVSVATSESDRAWVDNVASLTSGGSMDIMKHRNWDVWKAIDCLLGS